MNVYTWAKVNKLTSMLNEEAFRPNAMMTRAEMAKVIVSFAQLMDAPRSHSEEVNGVNYEESSQQSIDSSLRSE
ncbi:MAG: hypothetical protein LBP53_04210 [Candidatus Peribacteria bacterium]|jgi:hypothetical protein|nr:hypothetical protein [Candidatus Peribacteria bacterium]